VNNILKDSTLADMRGIFKDRTVLVAAALVLAALAATAWLLFGGAEEAAASYTHMHCSACQEEFPYIARLAGSHCAICENGTYTPTVGSVKDGAGAIGAAARVVVFVLVAAVLLQGLAYLAVVRSRALREEKAAARQRTLLCRCPYCRRKIGFPASKEGAGGVCPAHGGAGLALGGVQQRVAWIDGKSRQQAQSAVAAAQRRMLGQQ
jgi:hypothetical protein